MQKKELPANFRAGYAADLMDVYQLYSDLDFLEKGVDAAYDILTPWGSQNWCYRAVLLIFAGYCVIVIILREMRNVANWLVNW